MPAARTADKRRGVRYIPAATGSCVVAAPNVTVGGALTPLIRSFNRQDGAKHRWRSIKNARYEACRPPGKYRVITATGWPLRQLRMRETESFVRFCLCNTREHTFGFRFLSHFQKNLSLYFSRQMCESPPNVVEDSVGGNISR